MKELANYRKLFEKAKSATDATQKRTLVENLLNRYVNDPIILRHAEVYARAGKPEKIHKMVELELAMKEELRPAREGLSERDRIREHLEKIDEGLESSKLIGFGYRASEKKYGRLTPQDLNKQFTI